MRDLRTVPTETILAWIASIRRQLNTTAVAIQGPNGGATYSPNEARKLLKEYNDELDRRERGEEFGERGVIRSWMVEPTGYY